MKIPDDVVRLAINMVRREIKPPLDKDDAVSYVLYCMIGRNDRYNGKTPHEQYLIHHVKNDLADYLRQRLSGDRQSGASVITSQKVDLDAVGESILAVSYDNKAFAIDSKRLISIVDDTAGFPLGTMLSQGYKSYEIAETVGLTRGRVSQIRKDLYAKYKTQNL